MPSSKPIVCYYFNILDELLLDPFIQRPQSQWRQTNGEILSDVERRAFIQSIVQKHTSIPTEILELIELDMIYQDAEGTLTRADESQLAKLYYECFNTNSWFVIRPTVAYSESPEFAIIAVRTIAQGQTIRGLVGILIDVPDDEEPYSHRSVFNVVGKCQYLEGPLSRVNHDCKPNARFVKPKAKVGGYEQVHLVATKPILRGEEITISYSPDYFGPENEECLCASCENEGRNSWARAGVLTRTRSGTRQAGIGCKPSLRDVIYTYSALPLSEGQRIPNDRQSALRNYPTNRCRESRCEMLFTHLPAGTACAGCSEQNAYCKG